MLFFHLPKRHRGFWTNLNEFIAQHGTPRASEEIGRRLASLRLRRAQAPCLTNLQRKAFTQARLEPAKSARSEMVPTLTGGRAVEAAPARLVPPGRP